MCDVVARRWSAFLPGIPMTLTAPLPLRIDTGIAPALTDPFPIPPTPPGLQPRLNQPHLNDERALLLLGELTGFSLLFALVTG